MRGFSDRAIVDRLNGLLGTLKNKELLNVKNKALRNMRLEKAMLWASLTVAEKKQLEFIADYYVKNGNDHALRQVIEQQKRLQTAVADPGRPRHFVLEIDGLKLDTSRHSVSYVYKQDISSNVKKMLINEIVKRDLQKLTDSATRYGKSRAKYLTTYWQKLPPRLKKDLPPAYREEVAAYYYDALSDKQHDQIEGFARERRLRTEAFQKRVKLYLADLPSMYRPNVVAVLIFFRKNSLPGETPGAFYWREKLGNGLRGVGNGNQFLKAARIHYFALDFLWTFLGVGLYIHVGWLLKGKIGTSLFGARFLGVYNNRGEIGNWFTPRGG